MFLHFQDFKNAWVKEFNFIVEEKQKIKSINIALKLENDLNYLKWDLNYDLIENNLIYVPNMFH
jgi:hypothetical protein